MQRADRSREKQSAKCCPVTLVPERSPLQEEGHALPVVASCLLSGELSSEQHRLTRASQGPVPQGNDTVPCSSQEQSDKGTGVRD